MRLDLIPRFILFSPVCSLQFGQPNNPTSSSVTQTVFYCAFRTADDVRNPFASTQSKAMRLNVTEQEAPEVERRNRR
jgi:hypothetical protein